ncbi:MAG: hypothetical protein JSW59_13620 [Phycisphaerales bacterium]|nr:MAG: hypothetical protein JSW59_13620 [Phycisphaerales bacterium]
MNLLKKQNEGRRRTKSVGNVQVPPEVFTRILDNSE